LLLLQKGLEKNYHFGLIVNEIVPPNHIVHSLRNVLTVIEFDNVTRSSLIKSIKEIDSSCNGSSFVFIDGDKFLSYLLKCEFNAVVLVMRPYLQNYRPKSLLKHALKFLLIPILSRKGFTVGLLSIPGHRAKLLKNHWVNDLPLLQYELIPFQKPNIDSITSFEYFLLPGFIDSRKNPILAIEAFDIYRDITGSQAKLVFAGKIHDDVKIKVDSLHNKNVVIINEFLDRDSMTRLIRGSIALLLPYSNKGSSGLALEGANLGIPVILSGGRNWKSASTNSGGNLVLVKLKKDEIASAMERVSVSQNLRDSYEITENTQMDFCKFIFRCISN
jgi:hypothetical protein